jgi:hypothetical protein
MKHLKRLALIALVLITTTKGFGQKLKLTEGDLSPLKDEKSVGLKFTYDSMSVGKYPHEADYVNHKVEELNKDAPGKGDAWAKSWISDRASRFEPQFQELFEKYSKMQVSASSKYTLLFKTTVTEPGFNVGVWRKRAYIDGEAWIVETADMSHVIAKISVMNSPGRNFFGYDYDTGERIAEAYSSAGKKLGDLIGSKK